MLKFLVRKNGKESYVLLLRNKIDDTYSFVNLTKGHICPCRFKTIEEAMNDMDSRTDIEYEELNSFDVVPQQVLVRLSRQQILEDKTFIRKIAVDSMSRLYFTGKLSISMHRCFRERVLNSYMCRLMFMRVAQKFGYTFEKGDEDDEREQIEQLLTYRKHVELNIKNRRLG